MLTIAINAVFTMSIATWLKQVEKGAVATSRLVLR